MNLDRRGREYASWTVNGALVGMTFEVTFDNVTWNATTIATNVVKILVRGPDAPTYAGSILLTLGANKATFRVTDNPEIVIRNAGTITVT